MFPNLQVDQPDGTIFSPCAADKMCSAVLVTEDVCMNGFETLLRNRERELELIMYKG